MRILVHILIALAILGLGVGAYYVMKDPDKLEKMGFKVKKKKKGLSSTSVSKRKGKPGPPMIRTRITALAQKDHTIQLQSQGEIRTHNATSLTPQISGRVVNYSEKFEDGAYFNKGDILLELETADYLTEVQSAKAQLARAEASFAQEEARAKQAGLNWKDAGFNEDASDLVLRKPQRKEAEANVSSAQSSLDRAKRNLARTHVRAPYDGRVRKRNVGLGQQVGASTSLGEIFSTDFAEVRLPLTIRDLAYYTPPNKPGTPTEKNNITFTSILAAEEENKAITQWTGTILRAEGILDEDSRQLFVIARIDDPFGLKSDRPALYIGQPVRATIPAKTLKLVYTIPRKHLTGLNEILVIREGLLKRVAFTPIWSNPTTMITRDGIEPGDLLCTTRIPYAPEGAPAEIIPEEEETDPSKQAKPGDSRRIGRKGGGHGHSR